MQTTISITADANHNQYAVETTRGRTIDSSMSALTLDILPPRGGAEFSRQKFPAP
jgi:hypothetical protein